MYKKPIALFLAVLVSCTASRNLPADDFVKDNLAHAEQVLSAQLQEANKTFSTERGAFPRTSNKSGGLTTSSMYDWTPGFFPGSLWFLYDHSKNKDLKAEAVKWTEKLKPLEHFTGHHDLGFMMYCSYGNAYRFTGDESYKEILINAAKALSTRFNPVTGTIKSWNTFKSWHGDKTYDFPVIIDNMMNLEMLFFASKISGDTTFRHVAITHALSTMKNHFRPDHSSYHVVCYDSKTGEVIARETAQGYADNSTWSRGQAWAIYGFTMCYRETGDPRFLKMATGLADYFIKNLPADQIPVWDFNANEKGYEPGRNSYANNVKTLYRDASAAAITASALLELGTFTQDRASRDYRKTAVKMLQSLSSETYRARPGTNAGFIIKHCVGSIPHQTEIDVPLVYADYYYIEALDRYRRLQAGKGIFDEL